MSFLFSCHSSNLGAVRLQVVTASAVENPTWRLSYLNISENLLLKVITAFLNHRATGQAQVCYISLNLFSWGHKVVLWKNLALSASLLPPPLLLKQKKQHFLALPSVLSKVILLFFILTHFTLIISLNSWCTFLLPICFLDISGMHKAGWEHSRNRKRGWGCRNRSILVKAHI